MAEKITILVNNKLDFSGFKEDETLMNSSSYTLYRHTAMEAITGTHLPKIGLCAAVSRLYCNRSANSKVLKAIMLISATTVKTSVRRIIHDELNLNCLASLTRSKQLQSNFS